jgi:hypothetical protein
MRAHESVRTGGGLYEKRSSIQCNLKPLTRPEVARPHQKKAHKSKAPSRGFKFGAVLKTLEE